MQTSRHDPLLPALSAHLSEQIGLHFPEERWPDLMRGLQRTAKALQLPNVHACMAHLLSHPLARREIKILGRHLTIGETYFFREPQVFEALQEHTLPMLIHQKRETTRQLRLWSAGCSTGEEAYTLAIMLHRMLPDIAQWDIRIRGTDINPLALEKARAGIYGAWSFRNDPPWLRQQYFREIGHHQYEVVPAVRKLVTFEHFNLADEDYSSPAYQGLDIVFCRNVLMYFAPALAERIVGKLHVSLSTPGWLVVSPSEIMQQAFSVFEPIYLPGVILHRKTQPQPTQVRAPAYVTRSLPEYVKPAHAETNGRAPVAATQEDADTLIANARALANRGELEAALHLAERAAAAGRLNPMAHYLLGTILQEQGRTSEAALCHKRALYLEPDFVLAHFALGNAYRQLKQAPQSARHFHHARQLLEKLPADQLLPESEDMTAGRLLEAIVGRRQREDKAA